MTEYVHLDGAESVERAASRIASAADRISQSVGYLDDSLLRNRIELDALVTRFEQAVEKFAEAVAGQR